MQNIHDAFILASSYGFNCAFSNQSFELWLLLHFSFIDSDLNRADINKKLSQAFVKAKIIKPGEKYTKNMSNLYEMLEPFQSIAIANSERLWKSHNFTDNVSEFTIKAPHTKVHLLVKELLKNKRK